MPSDKLNKLIATFFCVGDFPVAPGTLASAAGALIAVCLHPWGVLYVIVTAAVTAAGFMVSGKTEEYLNIQDPSCVVIDEVAGILVALFLLPVSWPVVLTAFFLFRAFDMFKIYPVNKFEDMKGSVGIMTDDLIAGLYTNLTMHVALRLAGVV